MVCSDYGLPEPDDPNEDLRVSNDGVILVSDNDSDPEDLLNEYDQYQLLPSAPLEESEDISDEDQENINPPSDSAQTSTLPPITPIEEILVKEVWSGPPPESSSIEMDSSRIDEVKQAMVNITLPPGAIPEWATSIPEEDWKQQLYKRLEDMQKKKT
ncbi:uncharacterized protein [Leptinotarsa decemlineata]|uniref:uncharacterized protein n=1 Tax=Leptinotarsa decemlineata TaxID=7539 RepID=UPI003D30C4E8